MQMPAVTFMHILELLDMKAVLLGVFWERARLGAILIVAEDGGGCFVMSLLIKYIKAERTQFLSS